MGTGVGAGKCSVSQALAPSKEADLPHPWLAALSVLAGSLSASVEESTWALTSYLAANAIILPMSAWLARMVGRKRLLILAVAASPRPRPPAARHSACRC